MSVIQLREEKLADAVHQVATQEGKDAADVLADAVRQYLAAYREKRIRAEAQIWYSMPAEVRNQYKGVVVAVYNGEIVDSDPDRGALYRRMRDRFDRQPVLLVDGGDQPMPVYTVYSARQA